MVTPVTKASKNPITVQQDAAKNTFFRKSGKYSFFGSKSTIPFFNAPVQEKSSIRRSLDSQERGAATADDKENRQSNKPGANGITPFIQKKCDACEKEEKSNRKLQKKASGAETDSQAIESRLNASKGAGSALLESTRQQMESSFGTDFSNVRIHTDSDAVQMSNDLQAHAFAHGNDLYFNQGKYQPGTSDGKRLLAHELTHTIQQEAGIAPQVQRDFWDDAAGAVNSAIDTVAEAGHEAYEAGTQVANAAVETGMKAADAVTSAGQAVYDAGSEAVNSVADAGSHAIDAAVSAGQAVYDAGAEAVDWLATEAAQVTLAEANRLAGFFGGSVVISGTSIVITLPSVNLFRPRQIPIVSLPVFEIPVCFLGGATLLGPVGIGGALCVRLSAKPSMVANIGPGVIRNASIVLDPLAGSYSATGELYVGAALSEVAVLEGALRANGVIGTIEPPLALLAAVEGGLRATLRGSGLGAIQETVTLGYSGGALSLDLANTLKLGVLLEADLDLFANASVYNLKVCEYVWPAGHIQTGKAEEYTLPISITYGGGGPPVTIGPVASKPIPVTDIQVYIDRTRPQTRCLSLNEILADLCKRGIIPPDLCTVVSGATPAPKLPTPVPGIIPVPGPGPVITAPPTCARATPSGTITIPAGRKLKNDLEVQYGQGSGKHSRMANYDLNQMIDIRKTGTDPANPNNNGCCGEFKEAMDKGNFGYGSQLDQIHNSKSEYENLLTQAFQFHGYKRGTTSIKNTLGGSSSSIGLLVGGNPTTQYTVLFNETTNGNRVNGTHLFPGHVAK